ncbi:MAG: V-type ATP synthase subunit E [Oscillospiraceae bacterium]|nr:V-type ATP synthase subunit E [Oscillospiraceae bacterium]
MEKNNKTDNFLKAINKYSKLERQQIQNDIETVRDEELKKAEANGKKMARNFIAKEYSAVKTAVTGQYAVKNLEAQGKVYQKREEITNSVFEKAFKKLKDFTSTPRYKDLLIKSAKEIADIFKENSCVIFISENDNKFAQDIKAQFSGEVTVENDVAIKIGGIKGFCKDLKIVADNTLDSKLNSQKDWFTENSGLKVM